MKPVCFEIIPHPRYRGGWLLKPTRGAPFGLRCLWPPWVATTLACMSSPSPTFGAQCL
jgi:hypothetical protein